MCPLPAFEVLDYNYRQGFNGLLNVNLMHPKTTLPSKGPGYRGAPSLCQLLVNVCGLGCTAHSDISVSLALWALEICSSTEVRPGSTYCMVLNSGTLSFHKVLETYSGASL